MAGVSKKKSETLVETLKTSEDFTELLSLSKLSTQMEVLSFLQNNLFSYQMNYFQSHLLTFDELMEFLPEKDKPTYFPENSLYRAYKTGGKYLNYNEKVLREKLSKIDFSFSQKIDAVKNHAFLVNTIDKKVYHFNKKLINKFKFSYNNDILICSYIRPARKVKSFEKFARCKQYDEIRVIEVYFNMKTNLLVGLNDYTDYKNGCDIGGWYENGYSDDKPEKMYDD